jgi:4-hydroxy-2-oxoheptanedioate aldolase
VPSLKQRLAAGDAVVGPFVILNSPDLVEIIGYAGCDFAVIDCEHGPFGNEATGDLVRACQVSGLHAIVRVPANEDWLINKALDVGAEAVIVPQVDSLEAARRAVAAAKYSPLGHRGANPFTRASQFTAHLAPDFYRRMNEETMLIALVEGLGGVQAFDDIAQLEGVDGLFVGPVDLSHALGVPGEMDSPLVIARIREMVKVARAHGKPIGVFTNQTARARQWLDEGFQVVSFGVDTEMIMRAFKAIMADLKGR